MHKFNKFTHQKTSSSKEGRLSHFRRLQGRHSHNSFILVGPHNNSFLGAAAVQFQPLDFQVKRNAEGVVIDCEDSPKVSASNKGATEGNNEDVTRKSSFNGVIANAPIQKLAEVIELSDSPSPEPPQNLIAELPLLSVYNGDGKHYTPTFVFPNATIKDEECRDNFQSKIDDARKEIGVEEIMEPRPRNKHLYCGVCKQSFDEYLGHIKGQTHQDKSRRSSFTQHIKTLELQMNIGHNKKERQRQWKKIKAKDERQRKKEEDDRKKQEKGEADTHNKAEDGKDTKNKEKEVKIEAKIQAQSSSNSSSSSSSPVKVKKPRKPRKPRAESSKSKKKQLKKKKQSSSSSQSEDRTRQKQKKQRKKRVTKQKVPTATKLEEGKKKRGRPSKKDLQERRLRQLQAQQQK